LTSREESGNRLLPVYFFLPGGLPLPEAATLPFACVISNEPNRAKRDTMNVTPEQRLAEEFDRWAEDGRGEKMGQSHQPVTEVVIARMGLAPNHNALDLGCGTGWATRLLAARLPQGNAVGVDVSVEMIRRARQQGSNPPNVSFKVASAAALPFHDAVFDRCLSIESLYYHPDVGQTLREVRRVLRPGGTAFFMVNLFKDNPHTHLWVDLLDVPVHLLSADEYTELALAAGFAHCRHETIPDPGPVPESYSGKWYKNAEAMRESLAIGSLLIVCEAGAK
jgi:arsenite methyltransferase